VARYDPLRDARGAAPGLPNRQGQGAVQFKVIFKHALRNALIPVVIHPVGLQFGVPARPAPFPDRDIFALAWVGKWSTDRVMQRDYMVSRTAPSSSRAVVIINLAVGRAAYSVINRGSVSK